MALNEALAGRIREAFAHISGVSEKRMFSGVAFMVNAKMCVNVRDHDIMCRIDPAHHAAAVARKGCTTMVMGGRKYIGWVVVREDVLRTKRDLDRWLTMALEFNKVAKATKKRRTTSA